MGLDSLAFAVDTNIVKMSFIWLLLVGFFNVALLFLVLKMKIDTVFLAFTTLYFPSLLLLLSTTFATHLRVEPASVWFGFLDTIVIWDCNKIK